MGRTTRAGGQAAGLCEGAPATPHLMARKQEVRTRLTECVRSPSPPRGVGPQRQLATRQGFVPKDANMDSPRFSPTDSKISGSPALTPTFDPQPLLPPTGWENPDFEGWVCQSYPPTRGKGRANKKPRGKGGPPGGLGWTPAARGR